LRAAERSFEDEELTDWDLSNVTIIGAEET